MRRATALGAMTFLVGFLNASRVHRDDAEELYDALPVGAATRTGGTLLSLGAAAAAAAAMTAVAWLLAVGFDGRIVVDLEPLEPGILEPAQVPMIVACVRRARRVLRPLDAHPALAPLLTLLVGVGPVAWSIPWVLMGTVPYLEPGHTWVRGLAGVAPGVPRRCRGHGGRARTAPRLSPAGDMGAARRGA